MSKEKINVAISLGDPGGIGIEVVLKTLENKEMLELFTPILFGSSKVISFWKNKLGLDRLNIQGIQDASKSIDGKINVVNCWRGETEFPVGEPSRQGGAFALESLNHAALAVKNGNADILVTAPINKDNIQSDEFKFPGHTEYLEAQWGGKNLMFMVSEKLKVGLVTQHIPLQEVTQYITAETITEKLNAIHHSLKIDYGIRRPKIAVLGLNPHAGDNGLLGKEENEIIIPLIREQFDKGMLVFGPYPADSFFSDANLNNFVAVLAMYHDQGLIPFKTLSFNEGVNFTAGLPFVRTSPDHGTAYDIAGKGIANEESFRTAIYEGIQIFKNRAEHRELTSNPLKIHKLRPERGSD